MYAIEDVIEQLKEQIKLAPELRQNDADGGSQKAMLARLQEGCNMAGEVAKRHLAGIEGGARKYRRCLEAAIAKLEPLTAIWDEVEAATGAAYASGEQRAKAMERFKKTPHVITEACQGALKELTAALALFDESEKRAVVK